jgi:hypothetical protein
MPIELLEAFAILLSLNLTPGEPLIEDAARSRGAVHDNGGPPRDSADDRYGQRRRDQVDGERLRASSNRSRTREAPTPTNISTKAEPVTDRNGTWASPTTARAMSVFPVPGGPTMITAFGPLAPAAAYRSGARRNSTTSLTSCLTPS